MMVRWLRWHCPPDTGFEIRALAVWGRARYISVTEAPHNTDFHTWMGKKHFLFPRPPRPGTEPRTLAWKAAVLTTTLGPPPMPVFTCTDVHLQSCETQWRHRKPFWMGTRWKQSYIRPPLPYFIVLGSSVTKMETKAIEFHKILLNIKKKMYWHIMINLINFQKIMMLEMETQQMSLRNRVKETTPTSLRRNTTKKIKITSRVSGVALRINWKKVRKGRPQ